MIKQNWRNQTLLGVFSGITHNGEYFSVFFNFSSFTTDGFHTNSQDWFHDEWTFCRKKTIYLPGAHHAISWKTQFSESACPPQFRNLIFWEIVCLQNVRRKIKAKCWSEEKKKQNKKCGRRRGAGWINVVCQYVLEQNFEDRPVAENIFEEQETQIKTHFMSHKVQHLFSLS